MVRGYNGVTLKKPTKRAHEVADISFSKDRAICVCGWTGGVEAYGKHFRRE